MAVESYHFVLALAISWTFRSLRHRFQCAASPPQQGLAPPEKNSLPKTCTCEDRNMDSILVCFRRFFASEDGPTAVEYAIMLSLIVIVCLSAISTVGSNANSKFQRVASSLK